MGALFRNWLQKKILGVSPVGIDIFKSNDENAILDGSDACLKTFAKNNCGYTKNKGLDFVARWNGKYILGEAKFLTDFGGHQDRQLEDAFSTLSSKVKEDVEIIALLDGVIYGEKTSGMYKKITTEYANKNIFSALLLRDFLYQL